MNIQMPPSNERLVDERGFITSDWLVYFSTLSQQLQFHLSDDGYVLPQNTTDEITAIQPKIQPAILYNTTTNQPMVKVGNTFKTIQTV